MKCCGENASFFKRKKGKEGGVGKEGREKGREGGTEGGKEGW